MEIFSYHLVKCAPWQTLQLLCRPPTARTVPGLKHAECMTVMTLGAPILSLARMQLQHLAVFASWAQEADLDRFLATTTSGRLLSQGWFVRLRLLRRWGRYPEFDDVPANLPETDPTQPVVAVTVARLKLPEVGRFIQWGRPVEQLVRDHPGTTLALAAFRPPRTFSTFSIWRTQQEMAEMVHGQGAMAGAERHAKAMKERDRRDFHHSFTTLRFKALSEHGAWEGKNRFIPK